MRPSPSVFVESHCARGLDQRFRSDEFNAQRIVGKLKRFQRLIRRKLRETGHGEGECG